MRLVNVTAWEVPVFDMAIYLRAPVREIDELFLRATTWLDARFMPSRPHNP
jgi:hypothetical protein